MSEINEAFDVLSNELTRAEYNYKRAENDSVFSYKNESNDKNEEPKTDPLHDDWEIAQFHYPDLKIILNNLSTISWKVAYGYKAYLLESKSFSQRLEIANNIEKEYMCKYFGDINIIHEFAKKLIKKNRLEAARFLNKTIKALGNEIDAEKLIKQIEDKFKVGSRYESNIEPEDEATFERRRKENESHIRSAQAADAEGTSSGDVLAFLCITVITLTILLFAIN